MLGQDYNLVRTFLVFCPETFVTLMHCDIQTYVNTASTKRWIWRDNVASYYEVNLWLATYEVQQLACLLNNVETVGNIRGSGNDVYGNANLIAGSQIELLSLSQLVRIWHVRSIYGCQSRRLLRHLIESRSYGFQLPTAYHYVKNTVPSPSPTFYKDASLRRSTVSMTSLLATQRRNWSGEEAWIQY
jgi:hypothetical protein